MIVILKLPFQESSTVKPVLREYNLQEMGYYNTHQ